MKKICLFAPNLNGGGAERIISILGNHLANNGFVVDLVLANATGPYLENINEKVNLIDLSCKRVLVLCDFRFCYFLPKNLFLALVFFCVFILGNTSNMHSRRIMAVYPIAYTFFVYSQIHYNTVSSKKKTMKLFAVFYVFLLVLYIAFKYL